MLEGMMPTLLPTWGNSGELEKFFSLLIQRRYFLQGALMYSPELPTLPSLLTTLTLYLHTLSLVLPPTLIPTKEGFLNLATRASSLFMGEDGCPGLCRMLSSIMPSIHWMPIALPSWTTKNISRHSKCPLEGKITPIESHWSKLIWSFWHGWGVSVW